MFGNASNCGQREGRDCITTMCEVATRNCFTVASKRSPLLRECKIMDYVNGRGICCGNEVYFDYVDGNVVMKMYRDMPGVRMDRLQPNIIKTFSVDQWRELNKYLGETVDKVEGVFSGDDEPFEPADSAEVENRDEERVGVEEESATASVVADELPKIGDGEPIFPGKGLPAMTKSELEDNKEDNGKE